MGGAIDWNECPYLIMMRRCRCGYCAVCNHPKHTAIHGPVYGEPPGSKPYGHEFISRSKKLSDELEANELGRFSFLEMDYGENVATNDELTCSRMYGYRKTTRCDKLARYIYTYDGLPYCGWHARRLNAAKLRVIQRED